MPKEPIELLHPVESPTGNKFHKQSWHAYSKWKKQCVAWAMYVRRPGGIDDATGKRHVAFTVYRRRLIDDDNMIQGLKALRDSLVIAKFLKDDSPKWGTFSYDQQLASKSPTGKVCTRIIITDVV